jgi:hypothetical protein
MRRQLGNGSFPVPALRGRQLASWALTGTASSLVRHSIRPVSPSALDHPPALDHHQNFITISA